MEAIAMTFFDQFAEHQDNYSVHDVCRNYLT